MYLEQSPYQRDQLINIDQLIGRALDHGVELGDNHHQTIENYVNADLVPRLLNGQFPATALDRLIFIDNMLKEGKSIEEIKKILDEERKKFLKKPMDLSTLVSAYKGASKSLLMLGSIGFVIFLSTSVFINLPDSSFKKSVGRPVGKVLAEFIREAKPANSNSTDPLGLTNVNKVITINEKQEVTIQKTIISDSSAPISLDNSLITNDSLTVETIDVKKILSKEITFPNLTGATGACVLTLDIAQLLSCSADLYWTAETIKDIADTSVSTSLSGLSLTGTGINVARTGNTFALSLPNETISSIDGIKNNAGDIDFVAGAGVTITANDTNNTITFNLAGSGVNADLLDSIDSAQFLRSDTSDNFTVGSLTLDAGTTLSVLGTFTCTNCVGDSAIPDTITASNYLPLGGGSLSGALTVSGVTGLTDTDIPNTITIANTSSVSATALNSGTLGNGSVTLALGSFGSITGSLTDGNVADTITVSNYLPLAGGTMAGNVDFNTNLALNIGNSGTDFTASGGLNLAGDLDVATHGAFGGNASTNANRILHVDENFTGSGSFTGELLNAFYTGTDTFTILRGLIANADWQGGVGSTASSVFGAQVAANQFADTAITSLKGLDLSVGSQAGASGAITTATGTSISKVWLGAVPTTAYGVNIGDFGDASTTTSYGLFLDDQTGSTTSYAIYSVGGLTYLGGKLTASGSSTSAVGFNLNTAQAGPTCASLSNGDFGYDSSNTRIYWKGTGGTCSYWNRTGTFDIAERAVASESLEAGDVLAIDTTATDLKVKKSSSPYQKTLLGIESTDPTFIDNPDSLGNPQHIAKLALAGRVPTKVSTENGPVEVGDYLTSSSTPGVAMKATESGPVIGKALQSFYQTGVGKVLVLVNSSYYTKPISGTEGTSISTETILLGKNQIKLGSSGKIEISGDINLDGNLTISKTLFAQSVETTKLKTTELSLEASGGSVGTAKIASGTTKVTVPSNLVKNTSRIFVTALNFTSGQTLVVTQKQEGSSFTVEIEQPSTHDINFDWFIVN